MKNKLPLGIEPRAYTLQRSCSTTELKEQGVPNVGVEPTAKGLKALRSTTELIRLQIRSVVFEETTENLLLLVGVEPTTFAWHLYRPISISTTL